MAQSRARLRLHMGCGETLRGNQELHNSAGRRQPKPERDQLSDRARRVRHRRSMES